MFAGYNFRAKVILDMFAGCWIRAEQCVIKYYTAVCFLVAPDNPYTKAECDFLLHFTDTIMYIILLVRQTIDHLTMCISGLR